MPYLFAHFKEKITVDGEQVYFALSRDGYVWEQINNGNPIITCTKGEGGCRDIEIVRLKDGSFVILATEWMKTVMLTGRMLIITAANICQCGEVMI